MIIVPKIFNVLFDGLTARQREVLISRFGLEGQKPQTLEAIGKTYDVTRERVRQIEATALSFLKGKIAANRECGEIFNRSRKFLKEYGGVAEQKDFLNFQATFTEGMTDRHLALLLVAAVPFYFHREDDQYRAFYYLDKESVKRANALIASFVKSLKERMDSVLEGGYQAHLAGFSKRLGASGKFFLNYLTISKRIAQNPYGDQGLSDWPVISAKTIRDKIYLVLRKHGKPAHFEAIATLINQTGFGGKPALAPTVHNELIKDKRFVLVGRGMYGLSEHGYEPGIARDVIKRILKDSGPLRFPDIVTAVQKTRFFKANTVLANIQNKELFERREDGTYRIREA